MLNSSIHRNKSIIWGQSLTQTIQSIIWRLHHWAELGHCQPGHSHHKRERKSQTRLGLLRFDLNRQIWNKFANLRRISDAISKNNLFDSQSFQLKNKSFWFQKSPPWWVANPGSEKLVREELDPNEHIHNYFSIPDPINIIQKCQFNLLGKF
jgi:hypothetical protein